jgi:predicted ATP-dependent endonuclease of OLD family
LPFEELIDFLSYLPISIDDSEITDINQKGSGIQAIALYSLIRYLEKYRPTNKYASSEFIWAIEEPESFLHPKAQKALYDAFKNYSKTTQMLISTHSYNFLNADEIKANYLLKKIPIDNQEYSQTDIVKQDKFNWEPFIEILGDFVPSFIPSSDEKKVYLFLEGVIDIRYIKKALSFNSGLKTFFENNIELIDGNGGEIVKRATEAINIFNVKTIVLVDGDTKGKQYLNKLIGKGYKKDKNAFILESKHSYNPTIENLVARTKRADFKKQMPKEALEYWSKSKEILIFENDTKPPAGWDKNGFKQKLCSFMEKKP